MAFVGNLCLYYVHLLRLKSCQCELLKVTVTVTVTVPVPVPVTGHTFIWLETQANIHVVRDNT
jgi:hypothetical protein